MPHQRGTFVTIDGPTQTRRHHSKSIIDITVHTVGVGHSMSLDKYIMTPIHHYTNIQSIFTALTILPIHLPTPILIPGNH